MKRYKRGILQGIEYKTMKQKRRKKKTSIDYINIPFGFDIETTSVTDNNNDPLAFMYEWTIGYKNQDTIYYGRTYEELQDCFEELTQLFELDIETKRCIIYVHNLGYEFQFLHKYLDIVEVFAVDERKPLKVLLSSGIELRDSYILSGFSLDNVAKNLTTHKIEKLKDDFDYDLIRTQDTPLTDKELKYCEHDVLILLYYIEEQIELYNSNILNIPLTNTGRVRKFCKNHCLYGGQGRHNKLTKYKQIISKLTLEPNEYKLLKQAFMGGYTHANAVKTGITLKNVSSIDFTSSYPAVMCMERFPMSKGEKLNPETITLEIFENLIKTKLCVFKCVFRNIKNICPFDCYISASKCRNCQDLEEDNGRVYSATQIEISLTNIDYNIIEKTYDFDNIAIIEMYTYTPHYLPQQFIESIISLYEDKTTLKGVAGQEGNYMLKKAMLNSTYGMSVTDIVRNETTYDNEEWTHTKGDPNKSIEEYNDKFDRFLYYPWGVFITAYARANLWTGILNIGYDYIYSDTDSVKFTNYEKHKGFINAYNEHVEKKLKQVSKYYNIPFERFNPATVKGVRKMLGVWDFEGTYRKFKTLGAKRYMYIENEKLFITVAGLGKKQGAKYIESKCETIDDCFNVFNDDLLVPEDRTGKLTHTYIDSEKISVVKDYLGNYSKVNPRSGIYLGGCTFHMCLSDKYIEHLKKISNGYITLLKY